MILLVSLGFVLLILLVIMLAKSDCGCGRVPPLPVRSHRPEQPTELPSPPVPQPVIPFKLSSAEAPITPCCVTVRCRTKDGGYATMHADSFPEIDMMRERHQKEEEERRRQEQDDTVLNTAAAVAMIASVSNDMSVGYDSSPSPDSSCDSSSSDTSFDSGGGDFGGGGASGDW